MQTDDTFTYAPDGMRLGSSHMNDEIDRRKLPEFHTDQNESDNTLDEKPTTSDNAHNYPEFLRNPFAIQSNVSGGTARNAQKRSNSLGNPLSSEKRSRNDSLDWCKSAEKSVRLNLDNVWNEIKRCNFNSSNKIVELQAALNVAQTRADLLEVENSKLKKELTLAKEEIEKREGKAICMDCGQIVNHVMFCNNACHENLIL